jgi:uncharacterized protein (UPF0332 family)
MERAEIAHAVAGGLAAAHGSLAAALNNLSGPHGPQYRSCIAEMYFACFHMASALLASKGIRARSHDALQELLALHYVKPAALPADTVRRLGLLMERRHTAHYKTFAPVDATDVEEFRSWVSRFLADGLKLLGRLAPEPEAGRLRGTIAEFDRHGSR